MISRITKFIKSGIRHKRKQKERITKGSSLILNSRKYKDYKELRISSLTPLKIIIRALESHQIKELFITNPPNSDIHATLNRNTYYNYLLDNYQLR